ncbi:MAG: ParB N-terminal domain-containing protein [Flavobacteriales bacterium]|nr:ParB N-terminal domain-containing protein [Flavobacteriales bacterium]
MADRKVLDVSQLLFDPKNPRLPLNKRNAEDEKVLEHFILKENLFELIASIGEQGYVDIEPIIVVAAGDDKYTVVEGNRRLAALKLLANPDQAPIKHKNVKELVNTATHHPTKVPVLVYADRDAVLDYLGFRHITGVDEWDSLAKARYLEELFEFHDRTKPEGAADLFKRIARIIGSRADYVEKLVHGYWMYESIREEGYYGIKGLDDDNFEFSLLTTALSYSNLSKFVNIEVKEGRPTYDKKRLKELTEWLFKETDQGRRVPESRDLKTLSAVVADEKALAVFRSGKPLAEARRFTQEPLEFVMGAVTEADKLVLEADSQFNLLEAVPEQLLELLTSMSRRALDLKNKAAARFDESSDD